MSKQMAEALIKGGLREGQKLRRDGKTFNNFIRDLKAIAKRTSVDF